MPTRHIDTLTCVATDLLLHNLLLSTTTPCAVRLDADAPFLEDVTQSGQVSLHGSTHGYSISITIWLHARPQPDEPVRPLQCQTLQDAIATVGVKEGVGRLSPAMDALLELLGAPGYHDWSQRTAAMTDMLRGMLAMFGDLNEASCATAGDAWQDSGDAADLPFDNGND